MAKTMSIRTAFSVCAWGFLVSFPIPPALHAATRTDTFGVTVMVQDTCLASLNPSTLNPSTLNSPTLNRSTLNSPTAQTNPTQAALLSGAPPVSVTCRNLTRYDVTLSIEPQPGPYGAAAAPAPPRSAPIALPPARADKHSAFAGAANVSSQPPAADTRSSPQSAAPDPNAPAITVTVTY